MVKRQTFTFDCIVTGKIETYEIVVLETRPSGRDGQVFKFPQNKSCSNTGCRFRNTPDCPLFAQN